jgi:hypothetical protein
MDSPANDTITAVPGLLVGHWTDAEAATGCTVVLCPEGAVASADVRGGAPGTRETDLLRPGTLVERVHAVLLSGGSAFGLDAATGVMRWLQERGKGFPTPGGAVPIVASAVLFDLSLGRGDVRPDAASGSLLVRPLPLPRPRWGASALVRALSPRPSAPRGRLAGGGAPPRRPGRAYRARRELLVRSPTPRAGGGGPAAGGPLRR